MRAFQKFGYLSAVIRAALFTEFLLMSVRGDGADSEEKLDIKYALIGAGIGLFLAAVLLLVKFCIIRKHVWDNSTDGSMKRPSTPEPHVLALSHLTQSEDLVSPRPVTSSVEGQAE
uniref:uncharacterized protein tmem273 n=1 Tax=Monopterus albus TaxID=43700 RepID=UPI0009B4C7CF|nr:putative uncharacterized protein C10orf128 homolog [Monopterus albus]